jgi:5'-3' exonuclease
MSQIKKKTKKQQKAEETEKAKQVKNNNILIIDTSYVIFYRFHALESWFRRAYPDDKTTNYDIINEKFDKLFTKCINELIKKYKSTVENVIFCKDASRKDLWRTKLYPEYKGTRRSNMDIDPSFIQTYTTIIPRFIEKGSKLVVEKNAEADDVASVLAKHIKANNVDANITVITNDNDYLQLIQERICICNLQNKDLCARVKENPENELLMKILMGDVSDNIKGIMGKSGKRLANKYIRDKELLKERMKEDEEFKIGYILNETLVDFNKIPDDIQTNIIQMYDNI